MIVRPLLVALPLMAACTPVEMRETAPVEAATPGPCATGGLASLIGKRTSDARADMMLKTSGAKTLRWIAPNTAVTMDFRQDRLNVYVDGKGRIEKFSCA